MAIRDCLSQRGFPRLNQQKTVIHKIWQIRTGLVQSIPIAFRMHKIRQVKKKKKSMKSYFSGLCVCRCLKTLSLRWCLWATFNKNKHLSPAVFWRHIFHVSEYEMIHLAELLIFLETMTVNCWIFFQLFVCSPAYLFILVSRILRNLKLALPKAVSLALQVEVKVKT